MEIHETLEKERQIKKEQLKLKKLFADIDYNKRKVIEPMIENAAYMAVTMRELQAVINTKGISSANKTSKSPETDLYIHLSKMYLVLMKQLIEFCPPAKKEVSRLELLRNE
jgi:hypothetical protein